jgi:hypothetical protein
MRTSRGATIGVVTKLMYVHAPLSIRVVTGDVPCNLCWRRLGRLFKSHRTGNLGVSAKLSN